MLNELQQRVARLMSGLPAADDFALADGAALIVYGLVDRSTRDRDYFATDSDAVAGVVPALETALQRDGLQVARRRDAPGFVRLQVTDETGHRGGPGVRRETAPSPDQPAGLDLHPDELAADKMLALYGRAEGRDFHDVAALADRYPTERLLELAAAKDRGFDRRRFIEMLATIQRLRAADFPDPQRADELRAWFEQWQREITRSLKHPGRGR